MVPTPRSSSASRSPSGFALLPFVLLAALVLAAPPARAEGSAPPEDSARKLYDEANADYALGHYEEALKKFELAFRAKMVPALLFNIAQCHRQMKNFEQAATIYRSFLRMAPSNSAVPLAKQLLKQVEETIASQNHSQRAGPTGTTAATIPEDVKLTPPAVAPTKPTEVKPRVAELEPPVALPAPLVAATPAPVPAPARAAAPEPKAAAPAKVVAAATPPAARPTAPAAAAKDKAPAPVAAVEKEPPGPPPEPGRLWTWVAAGTCVAALAAGSLFGMQAKSTDATITGSQHTRAELDGLQSDLNSQASKANLFLGVGVGLAAVTAALFVLHF